jgi:ABC-type sulfate/molybdate transport systems ATPase subunit
LGGRASREGGELVSWQASIRMSVGTLAIDVDLRGDDAPVALIGPNGSGKTTLLRTIAGAYRPAEGVIRVADETLFDSARGVDVPPELRSVGYVPQGYGLFPHLSALDNVAFAWAARGVPREQRRKAALGVMERMGCGHLADRSPARLSGGEQQRVALARAITAEPRMLLLDEPLAALDAPSRRSIRSYLAEHLAERRGPALVVSHEARDVRALGALVYVLERGRVVQSGTADALAGEPASEFVAAFFET